MFSLKKEKQPFFYLHKNKPWSKFALFKLNFCLIHFSDIFLPKTDAKCKLGHTSFSPVSTTMQCSIISLFGFNNSISWSLFDHQKYKEIIVYILRLSPF